MIKVVTQANHTHASKTSSNLASLEEISPKTGQFSMIFVSGMFTETTDPGDSIAALSWC